MPTHPRNTELLHVGVQASQEINHLKKVSRPFEVYVNIIQKITLSRNFTSKHTATGLLGTINPCKILIKNFHS